MSANVTSTKPVAELRLHNGTPTVFVDGRPVFYYLAWPPAPDPRAPEIFQKVIRAFARRTGVHFYTFENGAGRFGNEGPVWLPGPGEGRDTFWDFSGVEWEFRQFIEADPEARFHVRILLDMCFDWWVKLYPEERLVNSDGPQPEQSYASLVWRAQVNDFLRALIAHIEKIGMADRVMAYQVNTGSSCEWFKYALNLDRSCGDYSQPMQRYFQSWLRKRYSADESALRSAWNNAAVTFETAPVPSPQEQFGARNYIFRDPAAEQDVVDYLTAASDLSADLIIDFSRTVKEASRGRALAGVFYGYWLGFQLNSDYFRDTTDFSNDYTRIQRTGHLGLRRVLESPFVDFLTSPMDYAFRGPGGHCSGMQPVEAVRAHGKLHIQENDDRSWHPTFRDYGACRNVDEFIAVYRRTIAEAVATGQGSWSVSIPFHVQKAERIEGDPVALLHCINVRDLPPDECDRFVNEFTSCGRLGEFALHTDRTPCAEICVLLDDESWYYQTYRKNLELPLVEWQHVQRLPRIGAPAETHILNDLLDGRLRPFKLYILLNAFRLDDNRRAKLKREIRRDGRVAVWIYAPGLLNKDSSTDNMTDLTGFRFAMTKTPWGPFMHVVDFEHEITRGLPEGLFWGTDLNLSPTFYLQDPDARVLASVVHAQGRCAEGMGVKEFGDWRSVYIAAPNIPASILRGLARYAGVHLYSEAGDVLYASRELLALHTLRGGERLLRLPHTVEAVYDLFGKKSVAEDTDHFRVVLPKMSTSVYYTGSREALAHLGQ